MKSAQAIDCRKCRHYFVTWQKDHPHGCKRMGFMSAQWPSAVVHRCSARACLGFEVKSQTRSGTRG